MNLVFDKNGHHWEENGVSYSDTEYFCMGLETQYDYYVSRIGDTHFPLLDKVNKKEYENLLKEGVEKLQSAINNDTLDLYYKEYMKKIQEYKVKVDFMIIYFFYKCIGKDNEEYIGVNCSVNPKFDFYTDLDDIFTYGSKSSAIVHYNLTKNTFVKGLKTLKGTYKNRLLNNVFVANLILPLDYMTIHECLGMSSYKDMSNTYKGSYIIDIINNYDNIKNQLEWKPYKTKETRRQEKLNEDGRWVNEKLMFDIIHQLYPDALRQWSPNWLISDKGGQMRCDVYIPSIKTVFEYQGEQHFKSIPFFDKTEDSFERRQLLDNLKKELLIQHNIKVCYVNYNENLTFNLIKEKLAEKDL